MTAFIESDVVVIGSGIGGAMAAYQLASKGKTVSVLEQGIRLSKEKIQQVFESESFIGNRDVPTVPVEFLGNKKKNRPLPSAAGGLARFYASVSLRMREREFDRWPFSYAEIEPYYSQAEQLMHISGKPGFDPCEPYRSHSYPHALPPMSDLSKRLSLGAEKLGMKPFQHPMAIHFEGGCVRCNFCNQVPCPYGVKWNPDSFLQEQKKLPIRFFERMSARKINFRLSGKEHRIDSITALNLADGKEIFFRAKTFVLAGGALLTPKLMLVSGLGDCNPLVGTHLMTHCLGLIVGFFPFQISAEHDFHKWWSVSDNYFDKEGNVRGLIQQDHLTTQKKIFAKIPRWLHPLVARFYYNTCQLLAIAEDEPRLGNRVVVNGGRDNGGVLVQHEFTKKDCEKRDFLAGQAKKIMKRAGALVTFAFQGKSVYHACGTCRMGESEADSVTNKNGLVWGTDNLYVTDAATFPTSSGVNPSLTIAANALRIADTII
ncbi:MAG: GMC family oxidoreductase [Deltaproteobacteria bacterium]|nr:GMC family oxidoreductase [Deltaproteobacteria bacterium]